MNKTTKILVFSAIVLLIIGMAFYPKIKLHFAGEDSTPSAPTGAAGRKPLEVSAKIMQPEKLTDGISVISSFIPDEEVNLSFEASGKITEIYFREGTNVRKGELLAKINDAPLRAELLKLEAQIPLARERVYRQETLLAKDAVSQEAFEQVTTELDKLNADIELVKARIAQTELRAPFDGVIGLRQVSEGAYVSPSTIIASLTKVIPLKIEFSVPEQHALLLKPGMPIQFTTSHDLEAHTAFIYAVEPSLDLSIHQQKARARFANADGKMRPGQTAYLQVQSREIEDALLVPNEAIIAEMGRDIIYVYSGGQAVQTEVEKGIRASSDVQILQGLNPGDTIITTGVMQLRDRMPVNLVNIIE
ncbi:efflux RND transporter periplasmic adaptor subunit [Bacteroidales bacterium OttesenSCG-928-L03]|nr:efflux RND transporter periplasmic adaptor subunit [Bacteroidales bacterium OttesenSCG-928-L03]